MSDTRSSFPAPISRSDGAQDAGSAPSPAETDPSGEATFWGPQPQDASAFWDEEPGRSATSPPRRSPRAAAPQPTGEPTAPPGEPHSTTAPPSWAATDPPFATDQTRPGGLPYPTGEPRSAAVPPAAGQSPEPPPAAGRFPEPHASAPGWTPEPHAPVPGWASEPQAPLPGQAHESHESAPGWGARRPEPGGSEQSAFWGNEPASVPQPTRGRRAAVPSALEQQRGAAIAPPAPGGAPSPSMWERPQPPHAEPEPAPQQPDQPAEQAAPQKRQREPYLDNVKFILIALVVIGHSLVPTLNADSSRALYLFIYTFHMPLFVVISGYLSRNFWNSNAKTNKLVDTFVIPYVIVEVLYAALRTSLGQKWSLTIIDPAWLNWYLLALLFWRLSTPVWKRMKYPIPVAIAIYLFAGFSQISGDFSMDRFFGLLPFFVIGLVLQPEHFELLNRRWIKIVSVVTLGAAAVVAILVASRAPLGPFYFKNSFQDLDMSWWMGLGVRGGMLVCALAMSVAVLALVPRGETWFSDLGTRTLYAYLLHGIPVLIAKDQGWLDFPWLHGPLGVLAITSSCFALAIVLCLPETRTVFKWLLEPRLTWLYRRPSEAGRPVESSRTVESSRPDGGDRPADVSRSSGS